MTAPINAVFCDVGGPIYNDENYVDAVLAALDGLVGSRVDRARFRDIYDGIRARQGGSLRTALAEEFLGDAARRAELHAATKVHWQHPVGTMYDDVAPFFRALAGRVKIGILANQEEAVVDALTRDGLADHIDVWGVSAIVGHEKPSPELFQWCLTAAGVTAAEAVHIGNRLDTDVRPAKALGLRTVWILRGEAPDAPTPEQRAEADIVVSTLHGLAETLLADAAGGSRS